MWQERDPVAHGQVQVLPARHDPITQARVVMTELLRLKALDPDWDWSRSAVIAREWRYLEPVRTFCEAQDDSIPVQMGDEEIPRFWLLREVREMVEWLRKRKHPLVDGADLKDWLGTRPHTDPGSICWEKPWTNMRSRPAGVQKYPRTISSSGSPSGDETSAAANVG